ncbi:MAG: type II and III secretion system protein, partial [Verrucomicrobiota bacterium]
YYDVARNHTRAKMLREIAGGWESPVPTILSESDLLLEDAEVATGGDVRIQQKLDSIFLPSLEFDRARIQDVLDYLSLQSQELDRTETDPLKRGISIVLDPSGSVDAAAIPNRLVTVRLANIPLGAALKYVAQQAGLKYRVDSVAVTVVPESVDIDSGVITRTFSVPPGFISSGGGGVSSSTGPPDPFGQPEPDSGISLQRVSAQQFLEQNGVVFGEGASARFVASTSTLIVRNTPDQMEIVNSLVISAKEAGSKNVLVRVNTISIEETALKELGFDWLLGASNLGSTPRVFASGGTDGNSTPGTLGSDYSFTQAGVPVGMNPVTAGLRSGDIGAGQTIEDVISRDAPDVGQSKAPGVFSIAGVFTDPQFQLVIRALNQRKGTDQLFNTHVVTRPGQIASIEQVREFIYPTEYDPPEIPNQVGISPLSPGVVLLTDVIEFPVTPATPTAFETRRLGSVIEVEPIVAADNQTISVNITADFSDFVGFINYGTPIRNAAIGVVDGAGVVLTDNRILMPVFEAIKETTNVVVWDGATVAIGGYHGETILQSEDKVPGIGDLPVVGRAFRSSVGDTTKQALLIFVTIDLIDPGGNPVNAIPEDPEPEFTRREPISPYPAVGAPPAGIYQAK